MRIVPMRTLAMLMAALQVVPAASAQSPPASVQAVKDRVNQIAIGGKLTVRKVDGTVFHGRLQAVEANDFSLREVDLKTIVTVAYVDVDRVRKDYGRKGFGGRRVDPRTNRIVGLVVAAFLVTLIIVAVAGDKS